MLRYTAKHFVSWVETVSASYCWRGLRCFRFGLFVQLNHSAGPLRLILNLVWAQVVADLRREVLCEQEVTVKVKANYALKKHSEAFVRQWLELGHHSLHVFRGFEFLRRQSWRF